MQCLQGPAGSHDVILVGAPRWQPRSQLEQVDPPQGHGGEAEHLGESGLPLAFPSRQDASSSSTIHHHFKVEACALLSVLSVVELMMYVRTLSEVSRA